MRFCKAALTDSVLDGVRHTRSKRDCTNKLRDCCQKTDLQHGECPGSHRRGVRVGDIVGPVTEGGEEEGDGGQGEDPVVAGSRWRSHCGGIARPKSARSSNRDKESEREVECGCSKGRRQRDCCETGKLYRCSTNRLLLRRSTFTTWSEAAIAPAVLGGSAKRAAASSEAGWVDAQRSTGGRTADNVVVGGGRSGSDADPTPKTLGGPAGRTSAPSPLLPRPSRLREGRAKRWKEQCGREPSTRRNGRIAQEAWLWCCVSGI